MRPGPLRDLPREVAVLTAVSFSVALGYGIVAPAIPLFARHFGVGVTAASAVVSVFALTRLASAPVCGRLVNRFGERRVMATGILIVAVSSALAGLSDDYLQLVLLRGAGGFGSAMFSVSAFTLLLRVVETEQRGRASGLFSGGFLVGGITGPAVGGLVTAWSLRAPFFLYAVLLFVPGAIAYAQLRTADLAETEGGPAVQQRSLAEALRLSSYRAALAANLADGWAALGVRASLVPLFVTDVLHRSALWTGIGFAVVAVLNAATLLPAGRIADRHGRRPVLVAGCGLAGVGLALLAVLPDLGGYLVGLAVLGVGSGLLDVGPAAVVGDVVRGRGGTVVATYQMAGDTGAVVGPVVGGRLADTVGYAAGFAVSAGVLGVAALLSLVAPETRSVAPADEEPAAVA